MENILKLFRKPRTESYLQVRVELVDRGSDESLGWITSSQLRAYPLDLEAGDSPPLIYDLQRVLGNGQVSLVQVLEFMRVLAAGLRLANKRLYYSNVYVVGAVQRTSVGELQDILRAWWTGRGKTPEAMQEYWSRWAALQGRTLVINFEQESLSE